MRRYERPHINEVWCGDSSVGPRLTDLYGKKHRVYILALIDDASRFITGIDVFYHDNFINLMSLMRSAIAKYGRPKVFNFDNGKSYKELRPTPNKDMRRYERPHINEVWCGDSSVGPRITDLYGTKHRVYIIALIDDASRFITGIDVFYHDNFINLMSVMRSAIAKYGRPKVFNFDNGKSYKNRQMELLAARIGTTLSYCQPYTPTGKAKIERWFRTMKDQWMAALDMRDFHSLDELRGRLYAFVQQYNQDQWMATLDMRDFHSLEELRGSLYAFVQQYNQSPHSSLRGCSPQDRFCSDPEQIRRLSAEDIRQNFLLEIERRVSADSVIVIDQIEYEVDYRFARQRIRLRYSPDRIRS